MQQNMASFKRKCKVQVPYSLLQSCHLKTFHLNAMRKSGDVVLGGLFEVHYSSIFPELSFTSEPHQPKCQGFDIQGFRHANTMVFAIEEINRNSNLLPNVTLGYTLYDNCGTLGIAFRASLSLVSGQEEQVILDGTCAGSPPVLGIVGDSYSTFTIAVSSVIGLYRLPLVSSLHFILFHIDRQSFPSFFRTIPSDTFQIMKRFGWTWAGLLVSDDDYGLHAARTFQFDLALSGGGCLSYSEVLPWGNDPAELRRIVDLIKISTAPDDLILFVNVVRQNVIGLQWMASEAWASVSVLQTPDLMPYLAGTIGIAIRRGEIPGYREFLLRILPEQNYNSSYGNSLVMAGGALCTGEEKLEDVETELLDVSNLRPEYNVYKAVYALAYALNDMLQCEPGRGPFSGHSCGNLKELEPWQV
uniref:Extracellular calcium-sensing receptor-like n=1 Tax=Sparus aurata TaxID=8175 RepID=A0A671U5Z0_SPAAU